jgi:hypothetical protein
MPREIFCHDPGCWQTPGHPGAHGREDRTGVLTCTCVLPNVGPNDECVRCYRVIAERVIARREGKL